MGPSASAGKNVKAPTKTTVPTSRPTNKGPCVGSVPAVSASFFLLARLPAAASNGIRNRNRPSNIAIPSVKLYHGVFGLSPPKALPLLPVALLYAYRSSLNPCAPELLKLFVAAPGGFQ